VGSGTTELTLAREGDRASSNGSSRRASAPDRWRLRLGPSHALLSSEQLKAAYILHARARLSIPELARRGYEQWGYSNVHSATVALYRLFRRYDYRPRARAEANKLRASDATLRCAGETIYGRPCRRPVMIGSSYCPYHRSDEL
jgi:hypothetical protein